MDVDAQNPGPAPVERTCLLLFHPVRERGTPLVLRQGRMVRHGEREFDVLVNQLQRLAEAMQIKGRPQDRVVRRELRNRRL